MANYGGTIIDDHNIKHFTHLYVNFKNRLPTGLRDIPIGEWDVSQVTDMSRLFERAINFNESLNDWNVSNVRLMTALFRGAHSFDQPLDKWSNKLLKLRDTSEMFKEAKIFNHPLNDWKMPKNDNMEGMFSFTDEFNQPLDKWDFSNVRNMDFMFKRAIKFNQPINISSMRFQPFQMFLYATSYTYPMPQERQFWHQRVPMTEVSSTIVEPSLEKSNVTILDTDQGIEYITTGGENFGVNTYLQENPKNMAFKYVNTFYLVNKDDITHSIGISTNIIYACNRYSIIRDVPYLSLKGIGIPIGIVLLSKINYILSNESIRCIEIINPFIKGFEYTASKQNFVCSTNNPQNLYDLKLIDWVPPPPESTTTGGTKRKIQTIFKIKSKSKQKHKSKSKQNHKSKRIRKRRSKKYARKRTTTTKRKSK